MIPPDAVEALGTLVDTAMRVVEQLRKEGLLERLVAVLGCMMPEDRETVLQVLEHDAGARQSNAYPWSRFLLRPNPLARVYVRSYSGQGASNSLRCQEARHASVVGARLAAALPPWGEGGWELETIRAWRKLSPSAREYVTGMSRRVLAALEANRRQVSSV